MRWLRPSSALVPNAWDVRAHTHTPLAIPYRLLRDAQAVRLDSTECFS